MKVIKTSGVQLEKNVIELPKRAFLGEEINFKDMNIFLSAGGPVIGMCGSDAHDKHHGL